MSSPGLNPGSPKAAELFEDVWKRLRELHQNALQGKDILYSGFIKASNGIMSVIYALFYVIVFRIGGKSEQIEKGALFVSML